MHPSDPRVVALCGSLRSASRTRVALAETLRGVDGAETTLCDLREYDLPAFDPGSAAPPDAVALAETVESADAVVLGTPNYHGSYASPLKTALDYLGRDEFAGTTVGLLEVAGGSHPGAALSHLRAVCRTLNAWTLPREVAVPDAHSTVGPDGIRDDDVARRVRRLGADLVAYAGVDEFPAVAEAATESAAGN